MDTPTPYLAGAIDALTQTGLIKDAGVRDAVCTAFPGRVPLQYGLEKTAVSLSWIKQLAGSGGMKRLEHQGPMALFPAWQHHHGAMAALKNEASNARIQGYALKRPGLFDDEAAALTVAANKHQAVRDALDHADNLFQQRNYAPIPRDVARAPSIDLGALK